jgi:hypothetical protein
MSAGLRILLIRHGETHGYYDNVGLTPVGEEQAHVKAKELAPQLPAGANVSISHAPTARATATASVLRASLVAELAEDARTTIAALEVDPLFDSLQFLFDGAARESRRGCGCVRAPMIDPATTGCRTGRPSTTASPPTWARQPAPAAPSTAG